MNNIYQCGGFYYSRSGFWSDGRRFGNCDRHSKAYGSNLHGIILELPWKIRIAKRPAGQRFEDRITLFAAALEAASNGEKQTQTSPEDDP